MIPQQGRLEISRSRLRHNLDLIRNKLGRGVKICATVKADAYGHGVAEIMPLLLKENVDWLAVYSEAEAVALLEFSGELPVLVLAPFTSGGEGFSELPYLNQNVRINVTDEESLKDFGQIYIDRDECSNIPLYVHVQVDTGLTRGGVELKKAVQLAEAVGRAARLEGIFAHLSHGDEKGHPTIAEQIARLKKVAAQLKPRFPKLMVHVQNSGGVWHVSDPELSMARVGIAMYGLQPNSAAPVEGLRPIARLVAPILAIHGRPANIGVGYGHTFITKRPSRLAIVPVGYAEGYPRALSNKGIVQIRNTDAPVVGRVSMDQIIVDVTDIPAAQLADDVTVISWDPAKPNSIDKIADATNTIGYEIATHLGQRLNRVVVD